MERKRTQRVIGGELDQFMVRVSKQMGQQIRDEARKKGVSLSNLIGTIFEEHFEEIKKRSQSKGTLKKE